MSVPSRHMVTTLYWPAQGHSRPGGPAPQHRVRARMPPGDGLVRLLRNDALPYRPGTLHNVPMIRNSAFPLLRPSIADNELILC